ncbi:MAG: chorismate synthase [Oscillospiraceae bacterium]|jgi:chorismate synthase|nr:chorismate synthase [Oscillospiraceae bacterium]
MSGSWGGGLKLSLFGESHGPAVGVVINGLPPGFAPDWDEVRGEMARRAPGNSPLTTPRRESDEWEVLSGIFEGAATGAPLCAVIRNADARSGDYERGVMRPGHADLTAFIKYGGYADYRGGGHFSGRLTAPLVFAGTLARQILRADGIMIGARILSIRGVRDIDASPEEVLAASGAARGLPVCSAERGERMRAEIEAARERGDSVGGVVECVALGTPPGWGAPFFRSLESVVAEMMFSIPAVKGVEFGGGFAMSDKLGSESNDQMRMSGGRVVYETNHNGGVAGGISTGQPIVLRVAIKPTPTISRPQTTVDILRGETVEHSFAGRHDPCVAPRAAPVIEAGLALCLLDLRKEGSV